MHILIWYLIAAISIVVLVPFFGIVYMSFMIDKYTVRRKYDE